MPRFFERKMAAGTAQVEIGSGLSGVLDALNARGVLHVIGSRGACYKNSCWLPWSMPHVIGSRGPNAQSFL